MTMIPQAGSALLAEVGWVDDDNDPFTPRIAQGVQNVIDGTRLEIIYETTGGSLREQVSAILQQSMAECGIQANIEFDASDGFWDRIFTRDFTLGEFAWIAAVEPPCFVYLSSQVGGTADQTWVSIQDGKERTITAPDGQNTVGFADEQYDLVCNNALNSLPGQPEYEQAHLEAQRLFAELLPVAPSSCEPSWLRHGQTCAISSWTQPQTANSGILRISIMGKVAESKSLSCSNFSNFLHKTRLGTQHLQPGYFLPSRLICEMILSWH